MQNIGITGHQHFVGIPDGSWLIDQLSDRIARLENVSRGYSSLAIGADMLFAQALVAIGIPLTAVIPCLEYESTFNQVDRSGFRSILIKASEKIMLDFPRPSQQAFFAAGKYIADHSDILFVLWDGKHAKGLGGTGDIFQYALGLKKTIVHINPWSRETITIDKKY